MYAVCVLEYVLCKCACLAVEVLSYSVKLSLAVADLESFVGGGANICWPVAGHLVKGVILALVLAQ